MLSDLHIHTTYSDGAFTPDEIIEKEMILYSTEL